MARTRVSETWWWVRIALAVLWPIAIFSIFFLSPGHGMVMAPFWFWMLLIIGIWILLGVRGMRLR